MRPTACRGDNHEETMMMLMKLTLPPFLSGRIFPKSHADRQDAFPPLPGPGSQRGDARLDGQTWHMRLGWRQRLCQWEVRHCSAEGQRAVPQRLDEQWDAQRERVLALPIDGPLDSLTRTHPSLRLVIYTSLT
jgi:hypothetical protein